MKPDSIRSGARLALAASVLFCLPRASMAQDPLAATTPVDEKARQRAEREAKKAAEQEERELKIAAEKERKEAEAAAREREKATARLMALEKGSKDPPAERAAAAPEALTREQERVRKAEEKARAEAEKARRKEDERARGQEARDVERRRKDEERAEREAAKARQSNRPGADRLEPGNADAARPGVESSAPPGTSGTGTGAATAPTEPNADRPPLSKDEEKRRRELVKQIEKARAERDRLNRDAEAAEAIARTARNAANEGQRNYEALATGLDVAEVSLPAAAAATPPEAETRRNRFVTKADEKQASAALKAPQNAADPLRIALDLKNPDAEARQRAAFALASLGPDAQPATRALMAALADPNPGVRVAAAQALGRIGPAASAALAPLSAALTDPDPAVKNAAQAALLAIQAR